jgi:D-methionine transport system ATP-binding protein
MFSRTLLYLNGLKLNTVNKNSSCREVLPPCSAKLQEIMIKFEDVSITFDTKDAPVQAVRNVSFEVNRGEIFGIVGTSGAGKSTLLRTVNLLEKPASGKVNVEGVDITSLDKSSLRKARQKIGMIFQHYNLIHTKTVYDNISFPMRISGKTAKEISKRVPELLEIVGLSDKARVYPGQLSGGQKQRVGIARALANEPHLLLCDEPTSALDLETTKSILELIHNINKKFGITVLLISHEMDVIKNICSRVAVMSKGEVVELNDVYSIFSNPQHEVTKQFVRHSLNLEIPDWILKEIQGKLVKVIYRGPSALNPVLSNAIRKYPVDINILHGRIEYINDQPIGILLVNLKGDNDEVSKLVKYLKENTASTEVINE